MQLKSQKQIGKIELLMPTYHLNFLSDQFDYCTGVGAPANEKFIGIPDLQRICHEYISYVYHAEHDPNSNLVFKYTVLIQATFFLADLVFLFAADDSEIDLTVTYSLGKFKITYTLSLTNSKIRNHEFFHSGPNVPRSDEHCLRSYAGYEARKGNLHCL